MGIIVGSSSGHGNGDACGEATMVADMDGMDLVDDVDGVCLGGNSLVQPGIDHDDSSGGLGQYV